MTTIPRRAMWLLAALALLIGPALEDAEAGRAKVTERHRDKTYKFSFKYFQDWKPVPLQPNETDLVCKFGDAKGKGQNRGVQDPTLVVHRMRKDGKEDEVVTGGTNMPRRPAFPGAGGGVPASPLALGQASVPEPGTVALIAVALAALGWQMRRRQVRTRQEPR